MEQKVASYFDKQPERKKSICLTLRKIILESFPNVKEEYRWGAVVYNDGMFYIGSVRRGVNLGFAITGLSVDELKFFKGTGKTMRHLKFESVSDIDNEKITFLLQLVANKVILPNY